MAGTALVDAVPRRSADADDLRHAILQTGRNCWRIERADRLAFLVDGQAYFSAFAAAAERARHSILVTGWDFHSRVPLHPDDRQAGIDDQIGSFLNRLAARRRIRVHVLGWDFAMIYALERELLPVYRLAWWTHRRFNFRLDGCHPIGGAHHQKIAVIDDSVAFVGGFDFGPSRWDTPEHAAGDPRRIDPWGRPYSPFHDVQIAVSGPAARALGDLVRERWRCACRQKLRRARRGLDAWPTGVAPDAEDVEVGIARTIPAYDGKPEVREIETLYLDAIAAAQRFIYIENQYLTSATIGDALAARLGEEHGPEVVVVQPRFCQGWLEQTTMGVLRARLLGRLRAADVHGRLRVFYPDVPGLGADRISVHSKVLVVDDRLARVGSANLNNRSMGLDSECDLAFEARGDERLAGVVRRLRNRLLAEHLGTEPQAVDAAVRESGSLIAAIERLRVSERSLRELRDEVPSWLLQIAPDASVVDPERPIDPSALLGQLVPGEFELEKPHRWLSVVLIAIAIVALGWLVLPGSF